MKNGNLLTRIYFLGQALLVFFFSSCFMFPVAPTKSQAHRVVESCIINAAGCVSVSSNNAPEINIQASNIDYPNNTTYDFGTVAITDPPLDVVFTIQNLGQVSLSLIEGAALNLGKSNLNLAVIPADTVVISGDDDESFTITQPTVTSISAGSSTTFTISFGPTLTGSKTASISISNDDADENPYIINLQGIGGVGK